jgi:phosphoribosylamine-glycine ligase
MTYVEKNFSVKKLILQEFIEGSIISSEYFAGKNGFIRPINHTIEVKKLMNDDVGPSTGCSGNIVWPGNDDSVFADLLRGVEEDLVKENYIGPIDINVIVSDRIYGLEWTPRFGLDAMPSLLQLIDEDLGKIISDAVSGQSDEMSLLSCFSAGARISIPPYPIETNDLESLKKIYPNEGIPILGLEKFEENCYYYEVMKKDGALVHSSGTGVIACVSDIGETVKECYDSVYDIIDHCKTPDLQYRTDLGKVLSEMHNDVKEVLEETYA